MVREALSTWYPDWVTVEMQQSFVTEPLTSGVRSIMANLILPIVTQDLKEAQCKTPTQSNVNFSHPHKRERLIEKSELDFLFYSLQKLVFSFQEKDMPLTCSNVSWTRPFHGHPMNTLVGTQLSFSPQHTS